MDEIISRVRNLIIPSNRRLSRYIIIYLYIDMSTLQCILIAPAGCLQYFTSMSAKIQSFSVQDGVYYVDQHYRICIASAPNVCQIEYFAKKGEFMLEKYGTNRQVSKFLNLAASVFEAIFYWKGVGPNREDYTKLVRNCLRFSI